MNKLKSWFRASIKRRVFALLSGFALAMFVFYSAMPVIVAYAIEDEVINQMMRSEASRLELHYAKTGELELKGRRWQLHDKLNSLQTMFREPIEVSISEREVFTHSGRHFHFVKLDLGSKHTYLVADVTDMLVVSNMSGNILILSLGVLLLTLLLTILISYLISKRTVKPVIDLTDAVRGLSGADRAIPTSLLQGEDEIGFLATSLQTSFDKLTSAMARESEFTRDVSHELRTPITVMSNMLQLNDEQGLSQQQAEQIKLQLHHLNSRVSVLLALARAEAVECKATRVLQQVEEAVLSLFPVLSEHEFEVETAIPYSLEVEMNPQLFTLLITNLVENALRHATGNEMVISATDLGLSFSNASATQVDEEIMKRSTKGSASEGLGQGLFIVARIIEQMGWQYELGNSDGQFELLIRF